MTAAVMDAPGDPSVLHLATVPTPSSINAEFLVKVVAAGVNPLDAKTRAGRGVASAITSYPAVLGHDFSGIVLSSPYPAHPLRPGDEVYGFVMVPRYSGSYAEYVSVPSVSLTRKPSTLSHVEAAGVPLAALTAWGMVVDLAKAHEGQRMLIHAGSGGVGHFAVQFASYFGASVTATGSTRNLQWLRELGASRVIDHTAERFDEVVEGMDVVIDLIGNVHDRTGSRSLSVLRPGGLIVNAPTGSWPELFEEAAVAGVRASTYRVAPDGATLAVVSRLLESGDVRVFIDGVFPLARAHEAHEQLETGHTRGKLVLTVSEG
ncbi:MULTISPECIES: NADP-dependent oxidoreductase [unclassified Rathayibacter]|uniref:NADP-dependent oxidoreductase n=1 Tax=unclassified Rathayibacter TaxID=2609250 RepID=UPI00188C0364|nr:MULTISPECIES: NADP-dependent oxidoreductase [unclassified Rathayibacter]MBF4462984.1 NADP-dependent oxidoreductase [Rathayibacter sp. VKM Ac-2879]MBF4504398.1 NADP-dependent oxidoreductase [Rathayibacter sp. VKM Ac-2878]